MSKARLQISIGLILGILSLGLFLYVLSIPPITGGLAKETVEPYDWPKVLLMLIFFFSTMIMVTGIRDIRRKTDEGDQKFISSQNAKKSVLVALALVLYLVLFRVTGFIFATWAWLILCLIRTRRWPIVLSISTSVVAMLFLIFIKLLSLPLPRGMGIFETLSRAIGH